MLACLRQNWSPEQVAGRLALEAGRTVVSHETIYRFIYARIARKKDYSWRHYLPRAKSKRGWRGRKGGNPASFIQLRRPLSERPADASGRDTPGHWEADLMLFGRQGQTVLVLHERHSRLLIALRQPGKAADPVANAITQVLASFPAPWRRTVAFDNGTEFARHHRLHALGVQTFFCDSHSPWQKGGVENAIGRMRRTLPRKTDLAELPDSRLDQLVRSYNNTPRKCLGYYTPAEILSDYSTNQVLHLKCESSFPQTRAVGATFLLRVPLPARFNGKYDPADRPSSTPTLLKPGDRRRFTKPGKTKPKSEPNPRLPKRVLPPKVERTPEEQGGRDAYRQSLPEQREAARKAAKDRAKGPRNSGSAGTAANRRSQTRLAARPAPKSTGWSTDRTTPRGGQEKE